MYGFLFFCGGLTERAASPLVDLLQNEFGKETDENQLEEDHFKASLPGQEQQKNEALTKMVKVSLEIIFPRSRAKRPF